MFHGRDIMKHWLNIDLELALNIDGSCSRKTTGTIPHIRLETNLQLLIYAYSRLSQKSSSQSPREFASGSCEPSSMPPQPRWLPSVSPESSAIAERRSIRVSCRAGE